MEEDFKFASLPGVVASRSVSTSTCSNSAAAVFELASTPFGFPGSICALSNSGVEVEEDFKLAGEEGGEVLEWSAGNEAILSKSD